MKGVDNKHLPATMVAGLFFAARMILLLSLPLDGVKSYGDFWNFFQLAELGLPYRDLWLEFPPLFPFLSRGIFLLVGGREHAYIYLSAILFSLAQAAGVFFFQRIAEEIWGAELGLRRTGIYAFLIAGLFYGWAYFDPLAIMFLLMGLFFAIRGNRKAAGIALGLGGLVKWFPLLALPAVWKWATAKKALIVLAAAVLMVGVVWGAIYIGSPALAKASLQSQGAKGSWETVWAILDGNLTTGNFDPAANRSDPTAAVIPAGNSPVVPPWMSLFLFAGIGLLLFSRAEIESPLQLTAFTGLTLIIFFLWAPGYSPQWVLYLLPFILLSLEGPRGLLVGLVVLLVNLLEWPLILSRGMFQYLPAMIILRTLIYLLVGFLFAERVIRNNQTGRMSLT